MKDFFNVLVALEMPIAIGGLFYGFWQTSKLSSPERNGSIWYLLFYPIFIFKLFTVHLAKPLSDIDNKIVAKAKKGFILFWIILGVVIIESIFIKSFFH